MKIKVSDYIANFLIEKGMTQVFTVVGGGAMVIIKEYTVFIIIMSRPVLWRQRLMPRSLANQELSV